MDKNSHIDIIKTKLTGFNVGFLKNEQNLIIEIDQTDLINACKILKTISELDYCMLIDVCAVDYLTYGNEKGLTHLVLDNSNLDNEYLKHVFNNDAGYSFLNKVFDSRDLGYKHHVKVYEIDFERFFSEWDNDGRQV